MKSSNIYLAGALAAALSACGGGTDKAGSPAPAQLAQGGIVRQGAAVANPYAAVVQQLYLAYFGRPADAAGLANFEAALAGRAPRPISRS